MTKNFLLYLVVMASVTYLIRMLPLVLVKKKITNRFLVSFLYYIPYAVLSVMTIPHIFYSTGHISSASVGFLAALFPAYRGKSLISVAITACAAVLVCEIVLLYI